MKDQFTLRITMVLLFSILMLIQYAANAQSTTERNTNGDFFDIIKDTQLPHDSTTTFTYTDSKGSVEPVYVGKKGSFYVVKYSKQTGNFYRKYL